MRRRPGEAGSVTAEAAVLLPTLVLVAAALSWLVGVGIAQVQCVDAARDAARALARDETEQTATELALAAAPDGARVEMSRTDDVVQVRVAYQATPPGALLDRLAALDLSADATTPVESRDVPAG